MTLVIKRVGAASAGTAVKPAVATANATKRECDAWTWVSPGCCWVGQTVRRPKEEYDEHSACRERIGELPVPLTSTMQAPSGAERVNCLVWPEPQASL